MANAVEPLTARDAAVLTKSDTTVYNPPFRALWVGGAGDVAIRTVTGSVVTLSGAVAGSIIPIEFDKLMSTNTTATLISGLRY